ncbi:MAG: hypothetical protein ABSF60_05895 [Verrucomicrobiota bacterium]
MKGNHLADQVCQQRANEIRSPAKSIRRWFNVTLAALAGLMLFTSTPAFGQQAFALEFNQSNNRFGTINLFNGSFTQLGSEGGTLFNDIAAAPDGALYGIINSTSFVTLNTNNGAVMSSVNFNVGGIESLAIAPDGTLYGATQGALYTIDPATGVATLVGNFNNSVIGNSGQNIRFGYDGNLYDTDGGVNATSTHLFQISTVTGAATLVGTVTNFPGLCLENSGTQMYGVGIQLGAASSPMQNLLGIDLNTIQPGGTNLDGSTLDISYQLLTSNFPNNFNISSADLYVVPGSILPIPEPNPFLLSITGGVIFLLVSCKRIRC